MPEGNRKPEREGIDPAKLEQLLEIELIQKRAAWQQTKARRANLRAISFLFLFLIIAAAFVVFYVFFSSDKIGELQRHGSAAPETTPAASASPP